MACQPTSTFHALPRPNEATSTSLSHTFTGLMDGTTYKYKVRAENASGFGAESVNSDAATPVATTLTAGSVESSTVTLHIGNYDETWYYRRTSPTTGS